MKSKFISLVKKNLQILTEYGLKPEIHINKMYSNELKHYKFSFLDIYIKLDGGIPKSILQDKNFIYSHIQPCYTDLGYYLISLNNL